MPSKDGIHSYISQKGFKWKGASLNLIKALKYSDHYPKLLVHKKCKICDSFPIIMRAQENFKQVQIKIDND